MESKLRILVAQNTMTEIGQAILRGVLSAAAVPGWYVWKAPIRPRDELARRIRESEIDGVIVHVATEYHAEMLSRLGVPAISTSNVLMSGGPPRVCTDDRAAGVLAGEYLRTKGYRRAIFIGNIRNVQYAAERFAGLRDVFGENAVEALHAEGRHAKWKRACLDMVRGTVEPVVLVCATDSIGEQVSSWAESQGLDIPNQCAVMGFNDEQLRCAMIRPPLTSVALPFELIGKLAFEMLRSAMEKDEVDSIQAKTLVAPLRVIERQSSSAGAIEDADICTAVALILEKHGQIRVSDLLEQIPVSRRSLETRFRQWTGRSPHQYILRARAERARSLLAETTMSITTIAHSAGFSGATHLGDVIRKTYGCTPSQLRRGF